MNATNKRPTPPCRACSRKYNDPLDLPWSLSLGAFWTSPGVVDIWKAREALENDRNPDAGPFAYKRNLLNIIAVIGRNSETA